MHHYTARLHHQVAGLRAERALRVAEGLRRAVPAAGRADAGRSGSGGRDVLHTGARKDTGGDGWADVWKRHHFAWEYKGRRADLDAAFGQLRQYALALENPPLLIVSDMRRFRIRTNWTNSVSKAYEFGLDDLADAGTRERLEGGRSPIPSGCGRARHGNRSRSVLRLPSRRSPKRCGSGATTRTGSRTSSAGWSSACSPTTLACCPLTCSRGCWSRRGAGRRSSWTSPAISSG